MDTLQVRSEDMIFYAVRKNCVTNQKVIKIYDHINMWLKQGICYNNFNTY